ncbi:paraben-hydrolyzing esterase precursor [Amniculicola lignicola CBS 123094]|uniref:Carboxylic ester hydrolase n=1 Tax=Amniculicola lignicola CBS 123094 TaxID=1392246 RepID=A0A6A5WQ54_9PLEO|nr:paraben-hydrolyzing esterase precursor [Amniculicola lignicola CBS 123094]
MKKGSTPYPLDLSFRGFIEGLTFLSATSTPLCHYFGGIPYGLPPVGPFRWQKPRSLPKCYRYGTRANPGRFTGGVGVCPQPNPEGDVVGDEEDCLQCNVWVPVGERPMRGWPVLVWIHGGFLQFGSANEDDLRNMLSETECKVIVVVPGYRLNLFGFLASPEMHSEEKGFEANVGFWDQRLALEWAWQNISYFGGDASNITIGGYSAGSHSTFHQLAYDLGVPDEKSIVKRALMLSNGPGMQPKSLDSAQTQFEELLSKLDIPLDLPASEKLVKLRGMDAKTLLEASMHMKYHQFRAVTDGSFVRRGLLNEIDNGVFAKRMVRRGIKLIMGECEAEHFVYGQWRPPQNSFDSLLTRLEADYPLTACEALMKYYYPDQKLPAGCKDWQDAFGRIYADIQIHHLERGMVNALVHHGAGDLIYRYRMEWRAKCCDNMWFKGWGVTHGTDMAIWFWGGEHRLTAKEKPLVKRAFHSNLTKFLKGEELDWGTEHPLQIRTLKSTGTIVCEEDSRLEEGLKVWEILKSVGSTGLPRNAKL